MATRKQIAANRRNAQKSTGPRTAEGKERSRWNALQHGVLARAVIPPVLEAYESRADFDALLATLREELAPASAVEEILVESIAAGYWRLGRLVRAEAGAVAAARDSCKASSPPLGPYSVASPEVDALCRALDDPVALRALIAPAGSPYAAYSDAQLRDLAFQTIVELQNGQAQARARETQVAETRRSIPNLEVALRYERYEAQLQRQIHRALHALERHQRLRLRHPSPALPPACDQQPLAPDQGPMTDHKGQRTSDQ